MNEAELLSKWAEDRPMYKAWGAYVIKQVTDALRARIAPISTEVFLRISPKARLKEDTSLLQKAFYRNKPYTDPYNEITDKVGVRFVVLLTQDIKFVEEAVTSCESWVASKDRDYEQEQEQNPVQFDYAAVHYVVRCRSDLALKKLSVVRDTSCEIQIKTILQHAYSELTHDTIYKPNVDATPQMRRSAAKSMALIESRNDYFQQIVAQVAALVEANKAMTNMLSAVYRSRIRLAPELSQTEGLILEAYQANAGLEIAARVNRLLDEKPYIVDSIKERAGAKLLYRQPSILAVYLLAAEQPSATKAAWPLTPDELRPVYVDLGIAFDNV
jgi:putative GTP pyrophosphokinase